MILEFAGVPGAGKTTVAAAVAEQLESKGVSVSQPTAKLTHHVSRPHRITTKAVFAAQGAIISPVYTHKLISMIRQSRQSRKRMYFKNIFNVLFLKAIYRSADPETITVMDQGLLQALWSIVYFSNSENVHRSDLLQFLTAADQPVRFVLIEAPPEITRERLSNRDADKGHPAELEEEEATFAHQASYDSYELIKKKATYMAEMSPNISVSTYSNVEPDDIERITADITSTVHWRTNDGA